MDTNLINELGTSEIAQTPEMNNEVQEADVRFASFVSGCRLWHIPCITDAGGARSCE